MVLSSSLPWGCTFIPSLSSLSSAFRNGFHNAQWSAETNLGTEAASSVILKSILLLTCPSKQTPWKWLTTMCARGRVNRKQQETESQDEGTTEILFLFRYSSILPDIFVATPSVPVFPCPLPKKKKKRGIPDHDRIDDVRKRPKRETTRTPARCEWFGNVTSYT